MADTGYFDSVSANLKTGVGAQVKGISEGVKANSEAGVSPSVNALDTGVKAAAAIGGLADGLSEAAMLPVLGAMGMKGMACLPISKQLDPVIGADIHLVTVRPLSSFPCLTLMSGFSSVRRTSSRRRSPRSSPRHRQRNRRATPTARSSPRWATPC